jgi:hypothetical protein
MQRASLMSRIGYLWSVWFYYIFSISLHKLQNFRKENIENIKCILNFFTTFFRNTCRYDNSSAKYDNLHRFSCTVPVIFMYSARYSCRISIKFNLIDRFSQNPQTSRFMKICVLGAEFFHTDIQTDMAKLIVSYRNIANVPKNLIPDSHYNNVTVRSV